MITLSLLLSLTAQAPTPGATVPRADDLVERRDDQGQRVLVRTGASASRVPTALSSSVVADWSGLGPFGGDIDDVAASPTAAGVVLAASAPSSGSGTAYRSTDGGSTWVEINDLDGLDVYDLEFSSTGAAYAGTLDGVWRSTDDGANWTQLPLGIGLNDAAREITIDPTDDQRIWVGVDDAIGNQMQNLLLSTDGGATWSDRTPAGIAGTGCAGVAVSPTNTNNVVAVFGGAFGGGAVYASTDGGVTWLDRSAGLPANPMNDVAFAGSTVYVVGGMAFGSQYVGVYGSANLGLSWTQLHDASWTSTVVNDIEVDPSNPNRILVATGGGGVNASTDGGLTWTLGQGGTDGLTVKEVSLDPLVATRVFLGTSSNAVWRSTNAAGTFVPSSTGISALDVHSIARSPIDPAVLAIAFQGLNDGGVYTSTDGGVNWSLEALPGTRYNTVGFHPNGTLYAISDGPTTIAAEGLYRRTGGSWTSIGPDQGSAFESELFALRFSENDPNLIFTGGSDFGVAGHEGTVWRSGDAGATWTKVYEGASSFEDVLDIEIVEDGTDQVALAAFRDQSSNQDGGVLRSSDGGQTWAPVGSLPSATQGYALSVSPSSATRFFLASYTNAAGAGGVWETTDAGLTWSNGGYTTRTFAVEADPNDANTVYAAGWDAPKLRVSKDGGATFSAFDAGADLVGTVRTLFMAPGGDALYAASSTGSWRTDLGDTIGAAVCSPAVPNSTGAPATIEASGSTAAADNDVEVTVSGLPPFQFALLVVSQSTALVPNPGGSQGTLCLGGTIGRYNAQVASGGAAGVVSVALDLTQTPVGGITTGVAAGETWYWQFWYRDVNPMQTSNFSDAVGITFQ